MSDYAGVPGVVETRESFGEVTLVVDPARLMEFISAHPETRFTPSGVLTVALQGNSSEVLPQLEALLRTLQV